MNQPYNTETPLVMHIDLNSCFASIEQQARPMLRNRPVAVLNRRTENTCVVTASYEAKAYGVKVGMRFKEAKYLCPTLIPLESDPAKYRYVYRKLLAIMNDYSAHVRMKSIDEGVIDFHETDAATLNRELVDIGMEIKRRLRDEVGRAMRCNVGIAPNRFLAKTAAGLHKPDGLDIITADNLRTTLAQMKLTELTGIAGRNEHRLNSVGIYTPLEFLDADVVALEKMVFKSINGRAWHQRLRGYEVDNVDYDLKTVGRQYVLDSFRLSRADILKRLHHLSESVGAKLRSQHKVTRGVRIYAKTYDHQHWKAHYLAELPFFSDQAIYTQVAKLFLGAPGNIREIGVSCYHLADGIGNQLSLFGDQLARERSVTAAVDEINNRYGERMIHSADTLGTDFYVKQKIPFGSTRYL